MQLTKSIVQDLLPVYLAGEASAETRAAVEEFLAKDAELRRLVESAGKGSLPPLDLPANLEIRSLERTRALLGQKNFWLAFALIFTFAPLLVKPLWLADCGVAIGLAGWVPFWIACKGLMATGLQAPRNWPRRVLWVFVGALVGHAVAYLIHLQTPYPQMKLNTLFVPAASALAQWLGEKFHQIPTGEEYSRPMSLFGK